LHCIPPSTCPHLIIDPALSAFGIVDLLRSKHHPLSMSRVADEALNGLDGISELNKVFLLRTIFEAEIVMFPGSP
jgi:hypothetical protein